MKIKLFNRTIEFAHRCNVDYSKPRYLTGVSFRKKDLKTFHGLKKFLSYCFMPYSWLEKREGFAR